MFTIRLGLGLGLGSRLGYVFGTCFGISPTAREVKDFLSVANVHLTLAPLARAGHLAIYNNYDYHH